MLAQKEFLQRVDVVNIQTNINAQKMEYYQSQNNINGQSGFN